jgi:polyisoprenoid-binding protein YceI
MSKWIIDPSHSEVQFKVKHLVISTVTGSFKEYEGEVESASEDFTDAKATFSATVNSIETNAAQRDEHLKSADFFDAANHRQLTFVSTGLEKKGESDYILKGNLTIKKTTKPIELNVEFGGIAKDMYGQTKAGFEITGKIKRQDFGLTWGALTEAGGLVVSDDVKLHLNIQLTKQA